MKRLLCTLGLAFAFFTSANAGPLFDDYLNYVRPGAGTGPGNSQITAESSKPIGQAFTVPAGTGEIYRIGIRPVYDTWTEGEKVTMSLYDSPEKNNKLGDYTIDQATSHVDDYVVGNGSEFEHTKDRVLFFQFQKTTGGRTQFYFELGASGGDGKVSFGAIDGKGVAFECHVKPTADREANLRKFFTERLDISRPELAAVKARVEAKDWEGAIAETVKHFHNRMELWEAWKDVMVPKPDPNADTKTADLLMNDQVLNSNTKEPMPWRRESYWTPEYPGREPNHTMEPSPYLWHIDRCLAGAYTGTGKAEYARRAIDLRMQWILDNPNPKVVYAGLEKFPWYFEQWSDRTSGARTPGHGDLVYARLYNFPGWTNDEKLVFFSFFEDNARWVYGATSGANWGAEAARASLDFGIRFPEWKMSPEYVRWGASRLAEITLEDVRRDGTSCEAAVKYHAMVARRLKGMVEDCRAGRASLEPGTLSRVEKVMEGMYEFMAYTLQPSSYVVMCGDSWYEDYTQELADAGRMLKRPDLVYIATQGKQGQAPERISAVFPEGGYFIMRSDFGVKGKSYSDSRQLFIHNGGWYGGHGHWDLLSLNLFGYGRTLLIDPGQYGQDKGPGIDPNWESKIHSMLVRNGRNVTRDPGPSDWSSNSLIDWYDGKHLGYGSVDFVRRRIAFIKPDYFLVDDSVSPASDADWMQVWNLTDKFATVDPTTRSVETTFKDGGNLLILNKDPEKITSVEEARGVTASGDVFPETKIVRLHQKTDHPRFETLLLPYAAGNKPDVRWERILPDDSGFADLFYSAKVRSNDLIDWAVFGECGKNIAYRSGAHLVDADFAAVRMGKKGKFYGFSLADGKRLVLNGKTLATSGERVHNLAVSYQGTKLVVECPEPEPTLAIRIGQAKRIVLNGKEIAKPVVKDGLYYPFADLPATITADDRDGFVLGFQSREWARIADPNSWATGYTHHETDPGRFERGDFIFHVAKPGRYMVELNLPKITLTPSDRVEYTVPATGRPVSKGGAIIDVKNEEGAVVFTVNQQAMSGWTRLGEFDIPQGDFKINARNATTNDGIYFTADAMRILEVK